MGLFHSPRIVTDGLVLCLDAANMKSYPGSGTTWTDLSGNGNNGTLTNGPTFSNGSIVFDGTNDYVQTLKNDIANNTSFSLGCWFNITTLNSTFRPLVDCGNVGTGNIGYGLAINNSNRLYVATNAGYTAISNSLSINVWYYVVGTASQGTPYSLNVYLNGNLGLVDTSGNTNLLTNSVSYQRIGQNINGSLVRFPGNISQVQIYNRALSTAEIQQNFNALRGRYGI